MKRLSAFLASAVVFAAGMQALAGAQTQPQRQLVYSYTVGVNNSSSDSSMSQYSDNTSNSTSDLGQITVGIIGVEADGGLVITVAENGRSNRTVAPATCVVYSSTNVECGAQVVTPEETSVVRALNPKFFDTSALDAKRHWRIAPAGSGVTIDYAATPVQNGVTTISGTRDESAQNTTTHSEMTYTYDTSKLLPTQVKEYETVRVQAPTQQSTSTVDITASLVSDSGLKHA